MPASRGARSEAPSHCRLGPNRMPGRHKPVAGVLPRDYTTRRTRATLKRARGLKDGSLIVGRA